MTGFGFVLGQRRAPGTRGGGCWRTTDLLRLVLASPAFLLESPTLDPRFSLSSSAAHLLLSVFSSFKPSLGLDSSPSCNLCSALFLLRSLPPKPVSLFQTSCLSLQSLHLPFLPLAVSSSLRLCLSLPHDLFVPLSHLSLCLLGSLSVFLLPVFLLSPFFPFTVLALGSGSVSLHLCFYLFCFIFLCLLICDFLCFCLYLNFHAHLYYVWSFPALPPLDWVTLSSSSHPPPPVLLPSP